MANDLYTEGLKIRKAVLGEEYVNHALSNVNSFNKPLQELVTEYCWGEIWTRDGLPRSTRSLINLAVLTALNRMHEFGVHVRGAIRNGVTEQEIQEVLMQAAIYVGVPAALESCRVAEKIIAEMRADD